MKQTPRFPPLPFASQTNVVPVSSLNGDVENCVALQEVYLQDSESAFTIMQPAIIGLDCHRAPITVVGEEFGFQINPRFFKSRHLLNDLPGISTRLFFIGKGHLPQLTMCI